MTLIGLYSPKKRSGKSTVAEELYRLGKGTARLSFAEPMLDMVLPLVGDFLDGGEDEAWSIWDSDEKDTFVVPGINVTMRHLMETIGTEWGRNLVHPDLWVMSAKMRARQTRADFVVFDDMRFENEHAMIRKDGGFLVKVVRPDAGEGSSHSSEGRLCKMPFDAVIENNGTVEDLRMKALALAWKVGMA